MLKTIFYFGNLLFFATFLYSITRMTDSVAPIHLILLVISTIGLAFAFYVHITEDK